MPSSLPFSYPETRCARPSVRRVGRKESGRKESGGKPVQGSVITPADAEAIGKPVRGLIADSVIPLEPEALATGVTDELRVRLQGLAREAGLLAPQAPAEYGGGGASFSSAAVLLEEAGYSLLGPLAMNCAAPDEGN